MNSIKIKEPHILMINKIFDKAYVFIIKVILMGVFKKKL